MRHAENVAFRAWARSLGYVVRTQPEHLRGDGDLWAVRLNAGRGWLWDAEESIGVHMTGSRKWRNVALPALAALPGWRLQTEAEDAVLGWVSRSAWTEAHAAILGPRRSRAPEPVGAAAREGPAEPLNPGVLGG